VAKNRSILPILFNENYGIITCSSSTTISSIAMDLVLQICDDYAFDRVWAYLIPSTAPLQTPASSQLVSAWPRDYIPRQLLSLTFLTLVGIHVLYFLFAGISYKLVFNHDMMRHPRFLKNQVKLEIQYSLRSFPGMTLLTLPLFQGEVMGYSRLYKNVDDYGWFYLVASVPL
jgi:lathosterol oxidase